MFSQITSACSPTVSGIEPSGRAPTMPDAVQPPARTPVVSTARASIVRPAVRRSRARSARASSTHSALCPPTTAAERPRRVRWGHGSHRARPPAGEIPTIDGIALTPKETALRVPPTFDTVEEERLHRKQKLAGALRLFGRFGFSEGVAGHITARDPGVPRPLLGQPVRDELPPHPGQRSDPRQPRRRRRVRRSAGEPGGVRDPLGDPRGAARRRRRRPLPLAVRQVVLVARHPARPVDPGRVHLLRRPHRDHRPGRRGRVRGRGGQASSPPTSPPARRRSIRTTACSPSARPSTRPSSGSSRWSARARRN